MTTENQTHIPEGWKECELGELLDYKQPYKYIVTSTEYSKNTGIPVLTAGKSFILGYTDESENIYNDLPVVIFDDFTTDSKYVDFPFKVKSSAMKFLLPKNEIDLFFVFAHLQRLRFRDVSGDHKRMWISEFSKLNIVLPTSPTEQQKIASILSKLDEAITQTEQLIAKYKKIKEGLMHDLLTRGIDEQGNIRSEETHKFKDSPLGRIPVEWNIVKLKHFGSKDSPYLKTGPFGSSLKTEHWRETGVPVITIGSLGDNDFILKNLLYVSETKSQELELYKLQDGDILFSRVADVGRSLVINKNTEGWIMSSNFMRLRLDKNMVIPDFLHLILKNSYAFKKQVFESVNENGRTVTNSKILNEFDFIFVPFDEQKNIVKIKEKIDIDVNSIIQQLDKLQLQKSGLMHDLLTGKIRVQI